METEGVEGPLYVIEQTAMSGHKSDIAHMDKELTQSEAIVVEKEVKRN